MKNSIKKSENYIRDQTYIHMFIFSWINILIAGLDEPIGFVRLSL